MSFAEIIEELPALTLEQREELVTRLMEMGESELPPEIEAILSERLAEHERNPSSALSYEEFQTRLQALLNR